MTELPRTCENGPTWTRARNSESSITDCQTRASRPMRLERNVVFGPMELPAAIDVSPLSQQFWRIVTSGSMATVPSMYVEAGSMIVTPLSMCWRRMRPRMMRSASASPTRSSKPMRSSAVPWTATAGLPSRVRHRDKVREVELTVWLPRDGVDAAPEPVGVEEVLAGVPLGDFARAAAVFLLGDALHGPGLVAGNASEGAGIGDVAAQERDRRRSPRREQGLRWSRA